MRRQFSLRGLFGMLTVSAIAIWLVRGFSTAGEPYWAVYLIGLTSVCAGVCGMFIVAVDRRMENS